MINDEVRKDCLLRLNKTEGQIKGIKKMVEQEKYCVDIINQLTAVRRALDKVGLIIMKRHVESCVADAIRKNKGRDKIDELTETFFRFLK